MAAELVQLARCEVPPGATWCDAEFVLEQPALICAGYESGLVTHGAQLAPAGRLVLRSLPVLAGPGAWLVLSDRPQPSPIRVKLTPRRAVVLPEFAPAPDCAAGCAPRDVAAVKIDWVPHGMKARAFPESGLVEIDPTWWETVPSVPTRLAVLAHELGHIAGAECQRCADYFAGQVLEAQGLSYRDAVRGFDSILGGERPAAENFVRGYLHG